MKMISFEAIDGRLISLVLDKITAIKSRTTHFEETSVIYTMGENMFQVKSSFGDACNRISKELEGNDKC